MKHCPQHQSTLSMFCRIMEAPVRNRMTREQQVEFLKCAEERHEANVKRYLRVPMIRDAVRKPAPGQDDPAEGMSRSSEKIKVLANCD